MDSVFKSFMLRWPVSRCYEDCLRAKSRRSQASDDAACRVSCVLCFDNLTWQSASLQTGRSHLLSRYIEWATHRAMLARSSM